MICLIALIVFAILGIFSAKYRKLAAEAFDCVFRRVTFRKCQTGLDTRLKVQLTELFMRLSPDVGRFVFRRFEILSWLFTALFVWSIIVAGIGGYHYWKWGNCNGQNAQGFCIFDPSGENTGSSGLDQKCVVPELAAQGLTLEDVDTGLFLTIQEGKEEVVFLGCYACEYTRKAYPTLRKFFENENVTVLFAPFPTHEKSVFLTPIVNCLGMREPEKVMGFNDAIFATPIEELDLTSAGSALDSVRANSTEILACSQRNSTAIFSELQHEEALKTGIYGTPLVFVNGEPVVGPRPYRVYKRLLP
ncbi:thioredoxin domain-containing protein [Candidatus Woesearchaeota archaeon]|nr:thioredoxin domain-containing protein [Candidatus Woesearchaeota archaeon]